MLNKDERKLIEECIQAYENMIKHHRKSILELQRQLEYDNQDTSSTTKLDISIK